jgi:hypothetical protein
VRRVTITIRSLGRRAHRHRSSAVVGGRAAWGVGQSLAQRLERERTKERRWAGVALATCSSLHRGEPIGDNLPTELVLFSLFRTSFALFCLA